MQERGHYAPGTCTTCTVLQVTLVLVQENSPVVNLFLSAFPSPERGDVYPV